MCFVIHIVCKDEVNIMQTKNVLSYESWIFLLYLHKTQGTKVTITFQDVFWNLALPKWSQVVTS